MKKKFDIKKIATVAGLGLLLCIGLVFFILNLPLQQAHQMPVFGATFSTKYAESLGIDWRAAYVASLDDLGIREFRIPAYWDRTEPVKDNYNFSDLDFQLDQAAARHAKVLLAVGRKLPRWPECHEPDWVHALNDDDQREVELMAYLKAVILRYKNHPAVYALQVENEPFFPFGNCPKIFRAGILSREIAWVRGLDATHQVVVTDSGEWSPWVNIAPFADIIGVSMYRESWNNWFGRVYFPIGPGYYQAKADLVHDIGKQVFVTELQVEPWGPLSVQQMTLDQMHQYFPLSKMFDNISFARKVGFDKVYVWGIEWWYRVRELGDSTYWDRGREIFKGP